MYHQRMNLRQNYCGFPTFHAPALMEQRTKSSGGMYFGRIRSPVDDFQYAPFQENGLTTELQNHAAVNIAPKGTKRKREDEIVFNPALRGINRKKTMVSAPLQFETLRVVPHSNNGSRINFLTEFHLQKKKKKKSSMKYRLYCQHCKAEFYSKATFREKYQHHLVNHRCYNNMRMQYVVGVRHRRCVEGCDPEIGCIRFVCSAPQGTHV